MASSGRTYEDAIERLNSLQTNASVLEAIRKAQGSMDRFTMPETIEYLQRVGYQPEDLNKLNVIHITGTKGKGSTSAFCDSLLRSFQPDKKIGLYTSPHLVAARERIRINGEPLSEETFAKYFFEVWDRFEANPERKLETTPGKPAYFRYMTTMAFHVFLQEKVDATILEVGVGGTLDSTNIVPRPIVTGVTALGIDHVAVLGNTIEAIAGQKGGIYKEGVPAFSVEQPLSPLDVLRRKAAEAKASSFTIVPRDPRLEAIPLGLQGTHQISNASLALSLVSSFLSQTTSSSPIPPPTSSSSTDLQPLPEWAIRGLVRVRWPGRCQVVHDAEVSPPPRTPTGNARRATWYLDGAHTVESLALCVEWYVGAERRERAMGSGPGSGTGQRRGPGSGYDGASVGLSERPRVLIFNCTSGRSAPSLLSAILDGVERSLVGAEELALNASASAGEDKVDGAEKYRHARRYWDHVVFCTNVTYASGDFKGDMANKTIDPADLSSLTVQRELASVWSDLVGSSGPGTRGPSAALDAAAPLEAEGGSSRVHVLPSVEDAVRVVERIAAETGAGKDGGADVLVTGSLHLIGGVIEVAGLKEVALAT